MASFLNLRKNTPEIVCPYCFEKFSANDVHFRDSRGSSLPDGKRDVQYEKFCSDFGINEIPGLDDFYIPGVDAGTEKHIEVKIMGKKHKILNGFKPKDAANETYRRLCPHCHNELPKSAGKGKSTVIAVLGSTQIGKTFYINSLIYEMKELANEGFDNLQFSLLTDKMTEIFERTRDQILDGTMPPTDREYIEPIIGELWNKNTNETTIISFYDFPGESTLGDISLYSQRQIENADGYLILYDLTRAETLFGGWIQGLINEMQEKEKDYLASLEAGGHSDIAQMVKDFSYDEFCKMLPIDSQQNNADNIINMLINKDSVSKEVERLRSKLNLLVRASSSVREGVKEVMGAENTMDIFSGSNLNTGNSGFSSPGKSEEEMMLDMFDSTMMLYRTHKTTIDRLFDCDISTQNMVDIYKLMQSRRKIQFYEDDKKKPNVLTNYMNGQTVKLKPISDWIAQIYASSIGDVKTNKPTAIVGTKSDEICETIVNRNASFPATVTREQVEAVLSKRSHELYNNGRCDSSNFDQIDIFVKKLLEGDKNFRNVVDRYFLDYHYFAVSALGTGYKDKMVFDEKTKQFEMRRMLKTQEITPWRATEPMLWLLYKLDRIKDNH